MRPHLLYLEPPCVHGMMVASRICCDWHLSCTKYSGFRCVAREDQSPDGSRAKPQQASSPSRGCYSDKRMLYRERFNTTCVTVR
jgi:hypothetical protein